MSVARNVIRFMAALLLGAVSIPIATAADKKTGIPNPQPGQAQIVFMRSSQVNLLVSTDVYDVTGGPAKYVGKLKNNRKVVVDVPPGDHVFMVGNVPWLDFMKASVLPDKRYFVIVAPHWPTNFSPKPVKHTNAEFTYNSEDFKRLYKKTKLADPAEPLSEKETQQVANVQEAQWIKWQAKTPAQQAELSIRPEDAAR